ncbi:SDR family oxidoreductase [uncultured Lentibacter sp.]|uniref:SDR family oxidoreductase n=1 Tax=uncultured Lentibacter sp. TaxID=1659309 RepID=UPI002637BF8E|nr:SDR family oxidoreductase [uncultured Lentibacter sp.]
MTSILITGASAGIGRATAELFLARGWRVGLLARRAAALHALAKGQPNAVVLPCDVTEPAAVAEVVESFVAQAGRLDVLFNNAGSFGRAAPIDELPLNAWQEAVDVNLHGMFYAARAAFGQMRRQSPQGGRIINNGSVSAHAPRENAVSYTVTKHAITGLTKSLSLDGRAYDIACGQIDIGNARTALLEEVAAKTPDTPPPMMDVAHVAEAVFNMASLPAEANVQFMTLMATKMPYIGRG